jgi:hypothetical protein
MKCVAIAQLQRMGPYHCEKIGLRHFPLLGHLASRAFAAEVSIKGNINQRYDASDNYFLVQSPKGVTVKSTTNGTFDFLAQTSTTSYLLNTYASYFKYLGPRC